jgi:hypothetical protein
MVSKKSSLLLTIVTLGLFPALFCGCAKLGPKSISAGRTAYAEAIDQTENEQLLLAVIKGRYGETSSLLAVNAVAANIRFRSEAGIEAGFGPENTRGENLLIGSLAYEENPTITYSPVQGEQYLRQLESPIPLDLLLLTLRSSTFTNRVLTLIVNRVNNLQNPDFLVGKSAKIDQRFQSFVDLFVEMLNAGVLELVKNPNEDIAFNILISGYAPKYTKEVHEFLKLIDLPIPENENKQIIIPAYYGVNINNSWAMGISTRSTFDLIEILRASVEIPLEDTQAGLTIDYPPSGLAGRGLRIKSSPKKPGNSSLAVKYRDHWFYIDETDQVTKAFFTALRTLWSISIAGSIKQSEAPIMTIPVSQ